MELILTGIIVGLFGWNVISDLLARHERERLIDRIMAKDYQEFEYYDKKYQGDLDEVEKLRDEDRKIRKEDKEAFAEDVKLDDKTKRYLEGMESDWSPVELDTKKLKEIADESSFNNENDLRR